jgi:hypothetical protein
MAARIAFRSRATSAGVGKLGGRWLTESLSRSRRAWRCGRSAACQLLQALPAGIDGQGTTFKGAQGPVYLRAQSADLLIDRGKFRLPLGPYCLLVASGTRRRVKQEV